MVTRLLAIRFVAACFLVGTLAGCEAEPKPPPSKALVRKLANQFLDASRKGDMQRVIDLTYPTVIDGLGGREKAIRVLSESHKKLRQDGLTIVRSEAETIGSFFTDRRWTFSVVSTRTEFNIPDGKMLERSYLLALSIDGGESWKFVQGSGLESEEVRNIAIPKLPEGLELPEKVPAEIIPKDSSSGAPKT